MANFHVRKLGFAGYAKDGTKMHYYDIVVDTAADIPDPAEHPEWEVGSELVVLENGGSKYQLSNAREWAQVNFNSGGGGDGMAQAMLDGVIEKTVTDIVSYASTVPEAFFKGYSTLKTVSFPKAESIVDGAFMGCVSLEHINFPKTVSIGSGAFSGCAGLTEIEFPSAVNLSSGCFAGCGNLKVAVLSACPSIPQGIFSGCSKLERIVLTSLVTLNSELTGLGGLKTLDLTKIESMAAGSLSGCQAIEALILRGHAVCTLNDNFANYSGIANGTGYIYVLKAIIGEYRTTYSGKSFADYFRAIEDYPEICG